MLGGEDRDAGGASMYLEGCVLCDGYLYADIPDIDEAVAMIMEEGKAFRREEKIVDCCEKTRVVLLSALKMTNTDDSDANALYPKFLNTRFRCFSHRLSASGTLCRALTIKTS